jgi:hypothetical protein
METQRREQQDRFEGGRVAWREVVVVVLDGGVLYRWE